MAKPLCRVSSNRAWWYTQDNDKKSDDSVEKLDGWQLGVVQQDRENQREYRTRAGHGDVR